MKTFEVIEEGRLNASEMNRVFGGYTCFLESLKQYQTMEGEGCAAGSTSYSICMQQYISCNDTGKMSCAQYAGPTGPDGYDTEGEGEPEPPIDDNLPD